MLGMLVTVLRLNDVTVDSRLAGEFQIALIIPVGISRTVLALPRRDVLTARRPPSLRPLAAVSDFIHFFNSIVKRIRGFHRDG